MIRVSPFCVTSNWYQSRLHSFLNLSSLASTSTNCLRKEKYLLEDKVQNVDVGENVGQAKIRHISEMSKRNIVKIMET